ncbi:MAG TPA: hypothetical protein VGF77_14490 [Allosphingosinicella sp.]
MKRQGLRSFFLAAAFLAACSDRVEAGDGPPTDHPRPDQWTIGPIIDGRDYSSGVPLHPSPGPAGAWHIDLPQVPGSVHYVTFRHGSLAGKARIVMRYRIDADPGVRIVPATAPSLPSVISLYFQRGGDDWSGEGRFETYRWYATFASQRPVVPGVHEMAAPLDGNWTAVEKSSVRNNQAAFRAALAAADRVGFVLGGGSGYGHGVAATGRARLTILDFRVE